MEEDEQALCTLTAEANNKVLGGRLGKQLMVVKKALAKLDGSLLWPVLEVGCYSPDTTGVACSTTRGLH